MVEYLTVIYGVSISLSLIILICDDIKTSALFRVSDLIRDISISIAPVVNSLVVFDWVYRTILKINILDTVIYKRKE